MMNLPPGIGLTRYGDGFPSMPRPAPISSGGTHRFQHYAMACPWSLWIAETEFDYAARLAQDVWNEVDRLEKELSRFVVSSDIYRINAALRHGDTGWTAIGSDTWECLYLGLAMGELTGGAFDIALAEAIEERRGDDDLIQKVDEVQGWEGPWSKYLRLSEDPFRAQLTDPRALLDLGAIGKGFALDKAAQLLGEWSIQSALFSCGQSTVFGIGNSPERTCEGMLGWQVELRQPEFEAGNTDIVSGNLHGMALSGSGQELHGAHIIDGRTGKTATHWRATWAVAPTAALSDACSTAFMAMNYSEIESFCHGQDQVGALLLGPDGKWQHYGLNIWKSGAAR